MQAICNPLTGSEGLKLMDTTIDADHDLVVRKILTRRTAGDSEQYKLLVAPIVLANDKDTPNEAGICGLQMTLLRKDPVLGIVIQDSHVLDIPVTSMPKGGETYRRQNNAYEDGVFTDITGAPLGDYEYTLTPIDGPSCTIGFTLTNNGVEKQAIVVGNPWVVVKPPPASLTAAKVVSLRAKLAWVTPDLIAL